ncbi:diguanylate cyclase [Bacillus solimangrovi]|uniref:Diguanylate cyclase n=1 Tax=Bacillus solimangrovi TaxID=1305675 RepID=A0A1E5LHF1_9BACI|nr:diguanylate cyclase [Bacillus solimangrovi]OEH93501.1 hypothetical protein BFG57_00465 [Bacillus solimangrovi]
MFVDLLNNLAVTATLLFIGGKFFEKQPLELSSPIIRRIIAGLGAGLLGTLLMVSTIQVTDIVIVDLRHLAIIIAAIYGGTIASTMAGIMIGMMRILLFGINSASISACILSITVAFLFGGIATIKISRLNLFVIMNSIYILLGSTVAYFLIHNQTIFQSSLLFYLPIAFIGGLFTYYMTEYIKRSNENNRAIMYYKIMADNSTDLISTHSHNGEFKYVSPSSKHILGYGHHELKGCSPYSFFHPEDFCAKMSFHDILQNEHDNYSFTFRFKRRDGSYVWLETILRKMSGITTSNEEIICFSRDITLRKKNEEKLIEANNSLRRLSNIDSLTEIANRRSFDETIEKEWKRAIRNHSALSLILMDIDHFKLYNDTYGHQRGDTCITMVAKISQVLLNRPTDFIARYGGEEFAIILPETSTVGAINVAEAIRSAIEAEAIPHSTSFVKPVVTVSIGIATMTEINPLDRFKLIKRADEALYKAKKQGRNRVSVFTSL